MTAGSALPMQAVRRLVVCGAGFLLALGLLPGAWAQGNVLLPVPPLKARVTDAGRILDASARDALEAKLAGFEQAHGSQIAILLVASTKPEPIEDFAHRVGEAWQIGRKGVGDGLLVVVARDDKRVRIDVARALEGAVPDIAAKRVIREEMAPRFAQGDFSGGLDAGLNALFKLIAGEALPPPRGGTPPGARSSDNNDLEGLLMFGLIGLLVGGSILKAVFGRAAGSFIGAVGAGVIAWIVAGSVLVALAIAAVALIFLLITGSGRRGYGGGLGDGFGGIGGSTSAGNSGGFLSGGGGDFGGGGASGGWGDGGD